MIWIFVIGALGFILGYAFRAGLPSGLPDVLVRWHRDAVRLWWKNKSVYRGGRPRIGAELIDLIRRMSRENPLWGAPRIHGELLKLGFRVAQSTVSKYMVPRGGQPVQTWMTFLRNHAPDIVAIDMLTVPTLGFDYLYAFVVLGHGRRAILHVEVTYYPSALWLSQQITEAFPWDKAPRYLMRDNDGAYGLVFQRRLKAMGIRDRPTTPHSPWQNGHIERLIGSIRRECLDHLRRVLRAYADYYNNHRTHLALGKDAPNFRHAEIKGGIISQSMLGGLHHRYGRNLNK